MKKKQELFCSFCGRSSLEVAVIPGADGNICVDCVKHANAMVERAEKRQEDLPDLPPTPTPRAIKEFLDQYVIGHDEVKKVLDQYVIGHDEVKKVLAVAVHNHYRRLGPSATRRQSVIRSRRVSRTS